MASSIELLPLPKAEFPFNMGDDGRGTTPRYTADQMHEYARQHLEASGSAEPGMVMVPLEPTEEMKYRGGEATAGKIDWYDAPDDAPDELATSIYRAMLAARPQGDAATSKGEGQ